MPEVKGLFHGGEINYNPEQQTLTGWGEYSGGFGSTDAYKVYFAMKTDTPLKEVKITDQGDKALYACLALNKNPGVVHLNVGISLKSIENASLFLSEEIADNSFNTVKENAKAIWDNTLSSIKIKSENEAEERLFYTTLYHSFVMPREIVPAIIRIGIVNQPTWTTIIVFGIRGVPNIHSWFCCARAMWLRL